MASPSEPPLRGLILAAGRGARLRPLTDELPKCLVRLAGRALLDWQIAALRAAGVRELAVVVGYRGEAVDRPGLVRFRNQRWPSTNMVASLLSARDWLVQRSCIVVYGDIAFHPEHLDALRSSEQEIAITCDLGWRSLWEERFARPEDDAESLRLAGDLVAEIGSPVGSLDDLEAQYMGLVKLGPRGSERLLAWLDGLGDVALERLQMTELLAGLVAAGQPVGAVRVRGRWCEVDSGDDLAIYEAKLAATEPWLHDWRF